MSERYSASGLQQAQSAPLSGRICQYEAANSLKRSLKAVAPAPSIIGPPSNTFVNSRRESYTLMTGIRIGHLQGSKGVQSILHMSNRSSRLFHRRGWYVNSMRGVRMKQVCMVVSEQNLVRTVDTELACIPSVDH